METQSIANFNSRGTSVSSAQRRNYGMLEEMVAHAPTAPVPPSRVLAPALELCVETITNAEIAARGGADRIELCAGLADGGVTPGLGLLEQVLASITIPVHCMIRPRGGDFCYTSGELRAMER